MRQQLTLDQIRKEWLVVKATCDERRRRLWAAAEALKIGHGGISLVCRATRLARDTVRSGLRELDQPDTKQIPGRIRAPGGGRKRLVGRDKKLLRALDALIEPRRERSESPLRWTSKGTRQLAVELSRKGHPIGERSVAALLRETGYDLRATGGRPRKADAESRGAERPLDRNSRLKSLNARVQSFHRQRQPVVVVNMYQRVTTGALGTVKRESSSPVLSAAAPATSHVEQGLRRFFATGVPIVHNHRNWESIEIDHEVALFVSTAVRRWWTEMGKARFPHAHRLLIAADIDGLNSTPGTLPIAMQRLADDLGVVLEICDIPRAVRRWIREEQCFMSFSTKSWRDKLVLDRQSVVRLIGRTTANDQLDLRAVLDSSAYASVAEAAVDLLAPLSITPGDAAGVWVVRPRPG